MPAPAAAKRHVTPERVAGSQSQAATGQQGTAGAAGEAGPSQPAIIFQQAPQLQAELGQEALPIGDAPQAGSRVIEAVLKGAQWEVVCSSSGVQQWTDPVAGKVVAVGGSNALCSCSISGCNFAGKACLTS